jgi:Flp pilus assembly protein TadB
MANKSQSNGGIGFLGMLTILFIGLKLTNYIVWSWWWVLSPIWLPFAIILGLFVFVYTVSYIAKKF